MPKELQLVHRGVVLSKKNSKRIIRNPRTGKPMVASNKAVKDNEHNMTDEFSIQTLGQAKPIACCAVSIKIFEPNCQRRDIDNQATSILDALVKAQVIADDSYKCVQELNVRFEGVDRENPRAEIRIIEQNNRV